MVEEEEEVEQFILETMPPVKCRIVRERSYVTPIKRRYLKRHAPRQEYEKLFSVNHLLDINGMCNVNYENFYRNLDEMLPQYDLVVVCDYGHGLLNTKSTRKIEKVAKFLAVNCQTNSSNHGMNVITKYHRADTFVVDESELRLPFGQSLLETTTLLGKLKSQLKSEYAWVTVGAHGALGKCGDEEAIIPAVTLRVKDTVGAGDAFYALASLCVANKLPIDIATLLGNVAGAIKTNLIGNSKPVAKIDLLKFLNKVLNV